MELTDYKDRTYLSSIEAAKYLNITVEYLHKLEKNNLINSKISTSGQKRFNLSELKKIEIKQNKKFDSKKNEIQIDNLIEVNNTSQRIIFKSSTDMSELNDDSIHLMITSPPYFNAKMYSKEAIEEDLGNIHDIDKWFEIITKVWREVFRVLQPGRKAFINIMNLPIRTKKSFKSLNLVGRTIDVCENIGFIFKRDIVWHKTNGVRAHFGTYPYPGGILINNMHEFILEFEKPNLNGFKKYAHLTKEQKELSKIDKNFWLSIKNSDVWLMKPQGSGDRRNHIAPFPIELPYRLIKAYSYISENILDPFAGSGTTLLAAADLQRNGIGYEISQEITIETITSLKNIQQKLF